MSKPVNHMSKFTMSDCGGIQKEDFDRDDKNPNLDRSKTKDNYIIVIGEDQEGKTKYFSRHERVSLQKLAKERIEKLHLPKAVRKDAVVCVSFLVSADKDFFNSLDEKQQKLFFNCAVNFYANRFGKENVLYGSVHLDEATPHMHLRISPVTKDGRLCAKEVVNRTALQMVQREFSQYMNKKGFKLEEVEHGNKDVKHLSEMEYRKKVLEDQIQAKERYISQLEPLGDEVKRLLQEREQLQLEVVELKEKLNGIKDIESRAIVQRASKDRRVSIDERIKEAKLEKARLDQERALQPKFKAKGQSMER